MEIETITPEKVEEIIFKFDELARNNSTQRKGQLFYNICHSFYPRRCSDIIINHNALDCYHNDSLIDKFAEKLFEESSDSLQKYYEYRFVIDNFQKITT
jgi:hypothetical protein